jgi:hypothetical protein
MSDEVWGSSTLYAISMLNFWDPSLTLRMTGHLGVTMGKEMAIRKLFF